MYSNRQLTIGVTNSSWMQQLVFLKNTIKDKLDEMIGPNVVQNIRFVVDPNVGRNRHNFLTVKNQNNPDPDLSIIPHKLKESTDKIKDKELAYSINRAMAAALKSRQNR
jgi:hypothetical protein